jgi:FAD/FMN-containing dehydrogenase
MDRRTFFRRSGQAGLLAFCPPPLFTGQPFRRHRPSDPGWPSPAAWNRLRDEVEGRLIPVEFPIAQCVKDAEGAACKDLLANVNNPYFTGDHPGLTQTLGWVDAWFTRPSVFAVAAEHARDVAAAVNFARQNDLRLVIKGGGHSYQGTSNAPDSLLVWTRHMHEIVMHDAFVPQGCEGTHRPERAVNCGSGAIWMQAYQAVTTRGGAYVQGGGATTVGVAGLVQSGGFGSFSKHYGMAAANLLEAEVVTADGEVRIANPCRNPDLFWALKGGGGGSFGVVSRVTLRVHQLPQFFGAANLQINASSDNAFRTLIRHFIDFYADRLFNHRWGEQAYLGSNNVLNIGMVSYDVEPEEGKSVWRPFLDWVNRSRGAYTLAGDPVIASIPARRWWDVEWSKEHLPGRFVADGRPGASPNNVWWQGNVGEAAWTIYGYDSLWLPALLLGNDSRGRLTDALFAGSRYQGIGLHFNKGLAGAPPDALAGARDTATNPAVLSAFCLAIVANGGGGYPGVRGREPDTSGARRSREQIRRCMDELRRLAPQGGAYVSEGNYFEPNWQHAYWGANYSRLEMVKAKYDPTGLFFVHNGVGSEKWSADGFSRL